MTVATQSTSFANDIRPLFRAKDINAMKKAFDLSDYDDVRSHADVILGNAMLPVGLGSNIEVDAGLLSPEQVGRNCNEAQRAPSCPPMVMCSFIRAC
jgi:hypothetical protein